MAGYGYDRFGPRNATALCLGFITIGFGLRPFTAGNFPATLILTVLAGVGLPLIVAPASIAAQWFGRHRMNLPMALGYSAVPLGQAAGLLLGARMRADLGITWAFGVMSIALVVGLLLWWVVVPEAPKQPAGPPAVKTAPLRTALRGVIRAENAWLLFGIAALTSGAVVFTGSFLTGFLDSTRRWSAWPPASTSRAAASEATCSRRSSPGSSTSPTPEPASSAHSFWLRPERRCGRPRSSRGCAPAAHPSRRSRQQSASNCQDFFAQPSDERKRFRRRSPRGTNGKEEKAHYNVKATGHVARLRAELGL